LNGFAAANKFSRHFYQRRAAVAAGVTAAKFPRRIIYLSAGGHGSVACLAISDGTNWKQIAIGANPSDAMTGCIHHPAQTAVMLTATVPESLPSW